MNEEIKNIDKKFNLIYDYAKAIKATEESWVAVINNEALASAEFTECDRLEHKAWEALMEYIVTLETENAELRENADVVKCCGFEIITEEAHGKYPARKVLRGVDGWTYVPGFPEETK